MTQSVYDGLRKEHPNSDYISNKLFIKKDMDVRDYNGEVYGGDVTFKAAKEL